MTPDAYRAAIAALNLSQRAAARVIGVNERTSRTYAAHGVPEKHSAWVRDKLAAYQTSQWAETFSLMTKASEQEGGDLKIMVDHGRGGCRLTIPTREMVMGLKRFSADITFSTDSGYWSETKFRNSRGETGEEVLLDAAREIHSIAARSGDAALMAQLAEIFAEQTL